MRSAIPVARSCLLMLVAATCLLALGCGSNTSQQQAGNVGGTSGANQHALGSGGFVKAQANLTHIPAGSAHLAWSSANNNVNVALSMTGLPPTGQFLSAVYSGPCSNRGSVAFVVPGRIIPDGNGRASLTQTVPNRPSGFPLNGSVAVQTVTSTVAPLNVACANLGNTPGAVQGTANADATGTFGPTSDTNQNVTGKAFLQQAGNSLIVTVTVSGLQPNTSHNEAIHLGTCALLGATQYGLPILRADGSGNASSSMTIQNVPSIPANGWYVGVQFGTDPSIAFNQTVACGNVQPLVG